jgi:hypothetical protein
MSKCGGRDLQGAANRGSQGTGSMGRHLQSATTAQTEAGTEQLQLLETRQGTVFPRVSTKVEPSERQRWHVPRAGSLKPQEHFEVGGRCVQTFLGGLRVGRKGLAMWKEGSFSQKALRLIFFFFFF